MSIKWLIALILSMLLPGIPLIFIPIKEAFEKWQKHRKEVKRRKKNPPVVHVPKWLAGPTAPNYTENKQIAGAGVLFVLVCWPIWYVLVCWGGLVIDAFNVEAPCGWAFLFVSIFVFLSIIGFFMSGK